MNIFLEQSVKALAQENGKRLGYFCTYTPVEIIHAAGFFPYRIIGMDKPIQEADGYMHANLCPYVRNCLDCALENTMAQMEGAVFMNACDAMRRLYDAWKQYTASSYTYLIDLPKRQNKIDALYLESQFQKFLHSLESHFSISISPEALATSIEQYRKMRSLLRDIYHLRKEKPISLKASNVLRIMNASTQLPVETCETLLRELIARLKETEKDTVSKPSILLIGNVIHHPSILEAIEACGTFIVNDDLCSGSRLFEIQTEGNGEPIPILSQSYLHKAPCERMSDSKIHVQRVLHLIEREQVDGVIHHTLKFCDNIAYHIPEIKKVLKEQGVPTLFLEGDYTSGSLGQLKTRVEAFVEMMS